jgi:hypothetical protein
MVTKVELEGTKMVSQKVPNGWSEGTKGVGTRYQSGNQKVPKWQPEGTKVLSEGTKE